MVAAIWPDLWAQFVGFASAVILIFGLSKVPLVRALWRRNVTEPFQEFVRHTLDPVQTRIEEVADRTAEVNEKVYELAELLEYQFTANGGGSIRDRINEGVRVLGGCDDPGSDYETADSGTPGAP